MSLELEEIPEKWDLKKENDNTEVSNVYKYVWGSGYITVKSRKENDNEYIVIFWLENVPGEIEASSEEEAIEFMKSEMESIASSDNPQIYFSDNIKRE